MDTHLVEQASHENALNPNGYENRHEKKLYVDKNPVCPCCSYPLLRHISLNGVYWYCSHCHQKMPPAHK
ncbi:hypothetical protein [Crocosphaera sp.]|uniref:hypothetical protein n=1 Tax=Crocosphaera sp. TaxID=2729996 RepID=UPI003F26CFD1|nr:hypothetical protein [Crocosphaera sp.]